MVRQSDRCFTVMDKPRRKPERALVIPVANHRLSMFRPAEHDAMIPAGRQTCSIGGFRVVPRP